MPRLLDLLKTRGLSNRDARAALKSGKVWVCKVPTADGGQEVQADDVEYRVNAPRTTVGRDLVVLWKDPHLAICWKPSGMLSVPAPRRRETNVLAEAGRILGSVHAVHRLDEGTSGLMCVARTLKAQIGVKALLETHDVERRYLAIAAGRLKSPKLTVHSSLLRNRGDGLRGSAKADGHDEEGRAAVTHLSLVRRLGNCSLIEARLETGRTHQVRIHLQEQGCAVLGDPLYASKHDARRAPRLALHAAVLGFVHPITGEALSFRAPLADDLLRLCRELEAP